ncbi:hypothetical protein BN1708_013359 [Verticillium longisporum]|uniref:Uncharacterized protein n=1 Tax=Verticillium longisporum TaxID=100787 RepID=A0A0G4LJS4_VERLO|nr:hypothetical protein BN1708_013359 [Verticillium longisporum]
MTLGRLHAILTNGIRLPRLVERLKHEDVVPPTDHATHRFLVILLSLHLPRLRVSAVFTTASAVPSWNLFQLSAVPTRTPGADALKLFILAASSGPVKFLRYNVSEPTVTA